MYMYTQIFIYFSKPLRLLYIIYEIVNFSFFALYSLLLLSFFLYLKSVPIHVIVHVYTLYSIIVYGIYCTCTCMMHYCSTQWDHRVGGTMPHYY